ncbi:MAG: restriction endonuclease subunit S [Polaromonas sp.]|uniref:restriction endonuclease subunit S n=1 Tax=Polaromonas sp. TaxID=1869339 RepID=UPI002487324F|nr:restriction endonuclease subunit S [Polaromonas sp.]MDI1267510.1 restriction endonuclease subunit S [Polaromonas sp.]
MIADLKPYPAYRPAEGEWLGDVPAHWTVRRIKYIVQEVDSRSKTGEEQLLRVSQFTGVTQRLRLEGQDGQDTRAASLVGYKRVEPDDLVINIMLAWNGSMGVSRFAGMASPAYCVYRFNQGALPWYFHHLFRSPAYKARIKAMSTGVVESRLRLYSDDLFRIESLLPPPYEQAAIVKFLDWANARLERTIRAKRRVIALLTEQKRAIIHRAVTHGLDPAVPLKPSDIPWLGEIPAHWEARRIKQVTRILRGKFSHRPRNDPAFYDGRYPFIQTGAVAQADKFIDNYNQTLNDKGLAVSKMFPSGTLVMTIAANIGEVAVLTFDACFPDSIVGFVPSVKVDRDYLYLVFGSMKAEFIAEAPVNTQGNLNVERIGVMGIPLPSLVEQKLIAKSVEVETAAFDTGIGRLEREIDFLREYRTRLVADVVTGKLDVRQAAARLPQDAVNAALEPEALDPMDASDAEAEAELEA